jgi:hypothetical protein
VLGKFAATQVIDVHVLTTDARQLLLTGHNLAAARTLPTARQARVRPAGPAAAENHRRGGWVSIRSEDLSGHAHAKSIT